MEAKEYIRNSACALLLTAPALRSGGDFIKSALALFVCLSDLHNQHFHEAIARNLRRVLKHPNQPIARAMHKLVGPSCNGQLGVRLAQEMQKCDS